MPCGWKELYLSSCRFQRESYGMSTKLILIALTAFLGVSQFANAGVLLWVNFEDNAPDTIFNTSVLPNSTFVPRLSASDYKLTANYYLQLTDGSSIYAYRFSVRFSPKLTLDSLSSAEQTQPSPLIENPSLSLQRTGAHEINRFNGTDPSALPNSTSAPVDLLGDGFYKLGSTTFTVSATTNFLAGENLVLPGQYERNPNANTNDLGFFDIFNSSDIGMEKFFPDVHGGTVAISSVPEPASAMVFIAVAGIGLVRRCRSQFFRKMA